uniref:NADH-ubiquinone oxidoreductase chain 2 n=1 Tax=Astrotischeria sp. MJT-2014 TaxID=1498835 RepID=A0A076EG58_9NEOP|nr:NADH dehydrogenase subunit 2 [Astrotischeria sp. MJT-2014]
MFLINSNKMFFMLIMVFSTMISISTNSWLGCWMGLEINLLSFIPLISNNKNLLMTETALKYFLVQSIASINFIFFVLLSSFSMKMLFFNNLLEMFVNSSLFMKMGAAPFHFWFPNIIESMSWMNCFLLMTWQKISPMILLSYFFNKNFLICIVIITAFTGAISGLNQSSLRKTLVFSSINHLSWLLLAMMLSETYWNFYFVIYSFLMLVICFMMKMMNYTHFNQIFFSKFNLMLKMFFFFNLLSLGGLPPFLGFLPKWMIIKFLMKMKFIFITFTLLLTALITLFFYIRISYSSLLLSNMKKKWFNLFFMKKTMYMSSILSFISMSSLMLSTMIFYIF